MNSERLWAAAEEKTYFESLENEWFYKDPLFNLCIQLSFLNSSNNESYGAIALRIINGRNRIIGVGWNIYMGGKTRLKRQGYANHAEFQSLALAESLGYNLKDTTIHVAGRLNNGKTLFLNPESTPFTCTNCTKGIPKHFTDVTFATPSVERNGWRYMTTLEAYYGSLYYQKNISNRLDTLINVAQVEDLNIGFEQGHIDRLIEYTEYNGIDIDPRIKWGILCRYEEMLDMRSLEKRDVVENITDERYHIYRGDTQGALFI
jgi:hypothetical protein